MKGFYGQWKIFYKLTIFYLQTKPENGKTFYFKTNGV